MEHELRKEIIQNSDGTITTKITSVRVEKNSEKSEKHEKTEQIK